MRRLQQRHADRGAHTPHPERPRDRAVVSVPQRSEGSEETADQFEDSPRFAARDTFLLFARDRAQEQVRDLERSSNGGWRTRGLARSSCDELTSNRREGCPRAPRPTAPERDERRKREEIGIISTTQTHPTAKRLYHD